MFAENFHKHDTNMNMNMPSRLTAILLLAAVSALCASASSRDLKGKVTDPSGAPVESALVVLMSGTDSTVMDFTYADTSGFFSLDGISDRAFVEVSFIGFEKVLRPVTEDFLTIVLEPSVERLDEVTVTASRGLVDRRPGRLVYSPPAEVAAAVNAYTILGYTPLVTVYRENVSVVGGKNAEIWIDGRKPVMGQEAAMDILRNTSADKIEKIEVVTSPGAFYRAAVGKAVINIVYKKEPGRGFDGSASVEGMYQFNKVSPRASLNLGYAGEKLIVSGNIGFRNTSSLLEQDDAYHYRDTDEDISYISSTRRNNWLLNGNLNLSYDFNSKNRLGASLALGGAWQDSDGSTYTDYARHGALERRTLVLSVSDNPEVKPSVGAALYYNLKTDDMGSNLDLSVNYSSYSSNVLNGTDISGTSSSGADSLFQSYRQHTVHDFRTVEAKAVYEHDFEDGSILKAGLENSTAFLSNDFLRTDLDVLTGDYIRNDRYSNLFRYDENISSAYISYDRQWNDVIWSVVGVRGEYTGIKGDLRTTGETFRQSYLNVFPSASLMFDLAEGMHSISVDYAMGIERPFYSDLNPFETWTTENTFTSGNIRLGPSLSHEVTLTYALMFDYMVGVSYYRLSDAMFDYDEYVGENIMKTSVGNFGTNDIVMFFLNLNQSMFNGIWQITVDAGADYESVLANIAGDDMSYTVWSWSAGIKNLINLSRNHGINMSLNYSYASPTRSLTWEIPDRHQLGLSFSKQFGFGGTVSIDAVDILGSFGPRFFSTDSYSYRRNLRTYPGIFILTYRQTFGDKFVRKASNRSAGGLQGRIKGE